MTSSALPGVLSLSYSTAGFLAPTAARRGAEEHTEDRAAVPTLSRLGSGLLLPSAAVSLQTSEALLMLMVLQLKRSMNDVKPFPQSMKQLAFLV